MSLRKETAVEYFKERVEQAMINQQVVAGQLTAFYVVNLLAGLVRDDRTGELFRDNEAWAVKLTRALGTGGSQQTNGLRLVGDASLVLSGFFSDSLKRKLVDIDYYIGIGSLAYETLASERRDATFAGIFGELAEKFAGFTDVLAEVSEAAHLTSSSDLLRLYEKWLRGSERAGRILVQHGIAPFAAALKGFVQ